MHSAQHNHKNAESNLFIVWHDRQIDRFLLHINGLHEAPYGRARFIFFWQKKKRKER